MTASVLKVYPSTEKGSKEAIYCPNKWRSLGPFLFLNLGGFKV